MVKKSTKAKPQIVSVKVKSTKKVKEQSIGLKCYNILKDKFKILDLMVIDKELFTDIYRKNFEEMKSHDHAIFACYDAGCQFLNLNSMQQDIREIPRKADIWKINFRLGVLETCTRFFECSDSIKEAVKEITKDQAKLLFDKWYKEGVASPETSNLPLFEATKKSLLHTINFSLDAETRFNPGYDWHWTQITDKQRNLIDAEVMKRYLEYTFKKSLTDIYTMKEQHKIQNLSITDFQKYLKTLRSDKSYLKFAEYIRKSEKFELMKPNDHIMRQDIKKNATKQKHDTKDELAFHRICTRCQKIFELAKDDDEISEEPKMIHKCLEGFIDKHTQDFEETGGVEYLCDDCYNLTYT
jgi:hypothetical protein